MKSALHEALRRKAPLEEIQDIIRDNHLSVYERECGAFAVHTAVQLGASVQVLDCLLQNPKGSAILLDRAWGTVLHFVGPLSSLSSIQYLVALYPALLRARNARGQLPLHSAALEGAKRCILCFLAHQYPKALTEYDEEGYLPIHRLLGPDACFRRIRRFVKMDQRFNVRQSHPHGGGLTLHYAVKHKCPLRVIRYFYDMFPDSIKARDEFGRCPLYHHFDVVPGDVVDFGSDEVLTFLLTRWADSDPPLDNDGNTVLHHAVQGWASLAAVKMLVQKWPDAKSTKNKQGCTPYQCAFAQDDPSFEVLALL
jgi:ankyrin repeat protein